VGRGREPTAAIAADVARGEAADMTGPHPAAITARMTRRETTRQATHVAGTPADPTAGQAAQMPGTTTEPASGYATEMTSG